MRKIIFLAIIGLLLVNDSIGQNVGNTAPDFTIDLLSGDKFTLSENNGKTILIFFFGNTCPSCIAASPSIQSELVDSYATNPGYIAIGIDAWNGSKSKVNTFKTQSGLNIPLGLNGSGIVSDYGSNYDRLIVIDREGIIRHKGTTIAGNDINNAKTIIDTYIEETAGISDQKLSANLSLFPNPATNFINISLTTALSNQANIHVVDATGKVYFSKKLDTGPNSNFNYVMNLEKVGSGLYFIILEANNKKEIRKFSVVK